MNFLQRLQHLLLLLLGQGGGREEGEEGGEVEGAVLELREQKSPVRGRFSESRETV